MCGPNAASYLSDAVALDLYQTYFQPAFMESSHCGQARVAYGRNVAGTVLGFVGLLCLLVGFRLPVRESQEGDSVSLGLTLTGPLWHPTSSSASRAWSY
jgi:hypothetical protein